VKITVAQLVKIFLVFYRTHSVFAYFSSKCVFSDAVNYEVYIAPVVDEHMFIKYRWDNADKMNPVPMTLFPPNFPHGLPWDISRVSSLRGRRQTA
jgi:hypothetical protein